MKVLVAVGRFPKLSETPMLNQVAGLLDRGYDVRIYAHQQGEMTPVHGLVEQYQLLARTTYYEPPPDLPTFDVVLAQFGPLGREFCDFPGKLATCFRGYDISRQLRRKNAGYYDLLWSRGDLFLPVCRYFRERLIQLGCPAEKIVVLHSAIDCRKFRFRSRQLPAGETVQIVSVGRLVEKKGLQYALDAVADLARRGIRLQYTVVGFGELEQELKNQAARRGIQDLVRFSGPLRHEDVIGVLDAAHLVLTPSVTAADGNEEGIPNVLKEAMAMGLPVVSTWHAGIPELVEDGVSGCLVPERDPVALAERLQWLIDHRQQWPAMGRAGRAKVEAEFDVPGNSEQVERLLLGLVAGHPS